MNKDDKTLLASINSLTPKTVPLGTSVLLMNLDEAVKFFPGHTHGRLLKVFQCLRIPLIHDRDQISFNLYTLERVLYYLLRPGGGGIALSGSEYRNSTRFRRKDLAIKDNVILEIGDTEVEEIYSAKVETERLAAGPRASSAARTAYLEGLKKPKKKPEKKEKTVT